MKKILTGIGIVLLAIVLWVHFSGNNHVYKAIALTIFRGQTGPDIDDLKDFPTRAVPNLNPVPWPKSVHYGKIEPNAERIKKVLEYQTTALLVIKDDSILYENYWNGYEAKTLSNSFSMSKSFIGALIGCALKDGFIKSLDEPLAKYVEAFQKDPYSKITIRHLLMMSSGLDFKESYGNLLAWPAKAYYGTDINASVLDVPPINIPGTIYAYKGGDTQLLGMILQKATGKRVAEYASVRLWQKLNAEDTAYWGLDVKGGMEKVSCCYYATAHDFARLGKLYMQYGKWNNEQIVDSDYVAQSLVVSKTKTKEGQPNTQYGYQWWIIQEKGISGFMCRGIKGQYILCIPSKKLIVVRLGHKRADPKGEGFPEDIFDYLNLGLDLARN